MLSRLLKKGEKTDGGVQEAAATLAMELAEITEISEKLSERLDEKMAALRLLHERADEKIILLERLIARAEGLSPSEEQTGRLRQREISTLARKGLKVDEIAGIVDMPAGEVELVLSIGK